MAMIQGIDGSVLLNALRAGRQDRMVYDEMQIKRAQAEREAEREDQVRGLLGQLFGAEQPQGVAAQVVPEQPQTFEEAFSPQAMAAIASGAPAAAPGPPPPSAGPPQRRVNREVMTQLIALDPEMGGRIVTALKGLDEAEIKSYEAKNAALGAAAQYLSRYPVEQRAQLMRVVMPQLAEAGWSPQEIDGANLSDEGLQGYMALSMDTDTLIDNELAEREFEAGKTVPVTAGGNVALVKPDGSARWVIGGAGGSEAPQINTPEDYAALPPGSEYIDPDGIPRRKPGGGVGDGTGGF